MRFIIVERTDDNKEYPVFTLPFRTREEADAEAKKHTPQHGGILKRDSRIS
jgi:hypothetical protein